MPVKTPLYASCAGERVAPKPRRLEYECIKLDMVETKERNEDFLPEVSCTEFLENKKIENLYQNQGEKKAFFIKIWKYGCVEKFGLNSRQVFYV
jgi:hypothetical protein